MGFATERKLAAVGAHDKPTVRAMEPITSVVSDSQILDVKTAQARPVVVPLRRRKAPTLSDLVTQAFFEDGHRQEASGVYHETEHVRVRSLDRVPRRWWPTMLAFLIVAAGAGAGAWWLGLRPPAEWQHAPAWQALHLPQLPPPAHPRWKL
jgi:hypothetical protein